MTIEMADDNAIDNLVNQLSSFHISPRMQRLAAEKENQNHPPPTDHLPTAPEATKSAGASPTLTAAERKGLPTPQPECRPVWEPPMFDYSWFEQLLDAEKEVNVQEGNKEIAWRTGAMDIMIDQEIQNTYR